jgi:diguanylate cyclase (GGDEF)-like protein
MPTTTTPPADTLQRAHDGAERDQVAEASGAISHGFAWMRFPGALEQQFLRDGAAARLRYVLLSGVLSLFVFNGFLPVDYLMTPDVFWLGVKLRLGLFTPVATILLLVSWYTRDWILRRVPPVVIECVLLTSGVCAAACLAVILAQTHSPNGQYYHVGLVVVVMYGNIVQRLRFWYAVAFSLAVYAIHIGGILMVPAFNHRLIVPMLSLMGGTVVFTLFANYALERDERKRYLLSLRRKHLLGDLSDVYRRLQTLSRMDALTGLYNRRHFQEYLEQIWQRAQHDGQEVSIIMLDVDYFKAYNDRYGHQSGDQCLAQVAGVIESCLRRPGDLVARFGGEEFIAVLPSAGAQVAQQAAERIRLAVEALKIPHTGSTTASFVTVSLGVASCHVSNGRQQADLIEAADMALYQAKHGGRNRCAQVVLPVGVAG